jgi:hypothetical protein
MEAVMAQHSTVLIALALLLGATVPCFAEEAPKQTFTCTAKTFNDCLMEAPCSAWKRSGPREYKLRNLGPAKRSCVSKTSTRGVTLFVGLLGAALTDSPALRRAVLPETYPNPTIKSVPPETTTILARLSVWAWNGVLRTTGRREPSGTQSYYRTRASRFPEQHSAATQSALNNRSINLFTAGLNYKFGGWGY